VGKIENCQVGVYLGYIAPTGHALLDRELYLPQDWCDDPVRRAQAKIPADVAFATKPALAQRILERAWAEGVPMQWVVGDSTYGNAPTLREAIANMGRAYVLEIPKSAQVQVGTLSLQPVESLVASLPDTVWHRYALNLSEQGLRWSDWAAVRVASTTDTLGEQWLVAWPNRPIRPIFCRMRPATPRWRYSLRSADPAITLNISWKKPKAVPA
jgi:hypothetical protein